MSRFYIHIVLGLMLFCLFSCAQNERSMEAKASYDQTAKSEAEEVYVAYDSIGGDVAEAAAVEEAVAEATEDMYEITAEDSLLLTEIYTELPVEEPTVENAFDLSAHKLEQEQIDALVARAEQKLSDYIDLLNLCADPAIETEMKIESASVIESLFIHKRNKALLFSAGNPELVKVKKIQERFSALDTLPEINSVSHSDIAFKNNVYTTILTFDLKDKTNSGKQYTVEVSIQKEDKSFGDETISVWQVNLGDFSIKKV